MAGFVWNGAEIVMDHTDRRSLYPWRVTIKRMDQVGIVVDPTPEPGDNHGRRKSSDGDVENSWLAPSL